MLRKNGCPSVSSLHLSSSSRHVVIVLRDVASFGTPHLKSHSTNISALSLHHSRSTGNTWWYIYALIFGTRNLAVMLIVIPLYIHVYSGLHILCHTNPVTPACHPSVTVHLKHIVILSYS